MLTVKGFGSAKDALAYYSHGDYYGSEGMGTWYGTGADELGLKGEFNAAADPRFKAVLEGRISEDSQLGRMHKGKWEHRPGYDLTFSAPKSFSIEVNLRSDTKKQAELREAMDSAAKATLDYAVEKGLIYTRKGKGGKEKENANKLIHAFFPHTTNRNLEPQEHIHTLLANAAICSDGKIRSINMERIMDKAGTVKFLGQMFRSEFASNLLDMGYKLRTTLLPDKSTSFEFAHISDKLIEAFSTRTKDIDRECKERGVTTKEGREKIVINSRKAKKLVEKEVLQKNWSKVEKQTLDNNLNQDLPLKESGKKEYANIKVNNSSASNSSINGSYSNSISPSTDNLSNKQSKYYKHAYSDIGALKAVNNGSSTNTDLEEIDAEAENKKEIASAEKKPNLISKLLGIKELGQADESPLSLEDITKLCIKDASSRKSVFSHQDLTGSMHKFIIGQAYKIEDIQKAIEGFVKEGELIKSGEKYTTKVLLQKEKDILKIAKKSLGTHKEILREKNFDKQVKKFESRESIKNPSFKCLNKSQRSGLKYILTSKDGVIAIDGLAGVGKSTILNAVRDISQRKIINLIGLGEKFKGAAPTASAAKTLKESAHIESQTLHSFLGKYQGYVHDRGKATTLRNVKATYTKSVIFVDEASLIATNLMHSLLTLKEKLGFKLVLVGDKGQLGAVEAGKDFEQLIKVIPCKKLDHVIRQKDDSHKKAVVELSKGNVAETFKIHDKNIEQHDKKIVEATVTKYLEGSKATREKTLLMSPTRKVRDAINKKVIAELQKENEITGKIEKFEALRQKNFTLADYNFAMMYEKNDVVKFINSYKNGIEKGELYKVISCNNIGNRITLKKDNKEFVFSLRKDVNYEDKIEVFEKNNLDLQVGLKIMFTKNNKKEGLINSESAKIEKINQDSITFKMENGNTKTIKKEELQHMNYGYCSTVHSAQGKTYDKSIAAIGDNKMLTTQKSWCVILSRHKENFTAIVHDKNKMQAYTISNSGTEMSAIELEQRQDKQNDITNTKSQNIKVNNAIEMSIG